jgi:hypothetical protein
MNPRRAGSKPAFTGSDRYIPESREAAIPLRMRAKRVSWNLSPSNSSATITPSCHQIRHREGGAYAIRYGNSRNPIVPAALACCGMAISFRHTGQRYLRSRSGEKMANTYSRKVIHVPIGTTLRMKMVASHCRRPKTAGRFASSAWSLCKVGPEYSKATQSVAPPGGKHV